MARFYPTGAMGGKAGSDECTGTAAELMKGYTAILRGSGDEPAEGQLELTGNAQAAHVLNGETFYTSDPKKKQSGTMQNRGGYWGWGNSKGNDGGNQRMWIRLPGGYYNENAEVYLSWEDIRNMAGITPEKVKKNEWILGIQGNFEGWVPEAQDLYYNGVNTAGFTAQDGWTFENMRIAFHQGGSSGALRALIFSRDYDVRSYSRLILEGYFAWTNSKNPYANLAAPSIVQQLTYNNGATNLTFDITQLTTIPNGSTVRIASQNTVQYITRVRLA